MATTTPNYGWDVPTSTDYVKDGATAIETLGDDIDASLFSITNGKNVGLVHINTTTATGAASVNIDSLFTSTFDNYRIQIDLTATSNTSLLIARLRASGADQSTNYNYYNLLYQTSGTAVPNSGTSDTSITLVPTSAGNGQYVSCAFDVKTPYLAGNFTQFQGFASSVTSPGFLTFGQIGGNRSTAALSDGIKIGVNAGTFTGTIRVYGYRN